MSDKDVKTLPFLAVSDAFDSIQLNAYKLKWLVNDFDFFYCREDCEIFYSFARYGALFGVIRDILCNLMDDIDKLDSIVNPEVVFHDPYILRKSEFYRRIANSGEKTASAS